MQKSEEAIIKDFLNKNLYEYQKALEKEHFPDVIMAFSKKLKKNVAIKIIKLSNQQNDINLQVLDRQIQSVQKIQKENNVLQIIEKIQDHQRGLIGIITEFIDCNLTTILELNQLNIQQVLAMTYQLLKGLLVLQENSLFDFNINPCNILYSKIKNQFLIDNCGISSILQSTSISQTVKNNVYSLGQIVTEALIQRKLTKVEQEGLKTQSLIQVVPFLINSQQIEFINKILCNMLEPNNLVRSKPAFLLQKLKGFNIDQNSLKLLRLKKQLNELLINISNIDQISQAIDCDTLEINFFDCKDFQVETAKNIGKKLQKCQNITNLIIDLSDNNLRAKGAKSIDKILNECLNITSLTLYLSWNNLESQDAKHVQLSLEKFQFLTSLALDVGGNNLGAEGAKYIGMSLEKCQSLISLTLYLNQNNIGSEGIKNVAVSIEKCQNLTILDLNFSSNNLGAEDVKNIGLSIEKCQNIINLNLDLSFNDLGVFGAKNIGTSLEKCQNLSYLDLSLGNNNLLEEGGKNIGISLEKCNNLISLTICLDDNRISEEAVKIIGKSLEMCKNLVYLSIYLSQNNIGIEGAKSFGKSLEKCQNITKLTLNVVYNNLGVDGVSNIEKSLIKCQHIHSLILYLSKNDAEDITRKLDKRLKKKMKRLVCNLRLY